MVPEQPQARSTRSPDEGDSAGAAHTDKGPPCTTLHPSWEEHVGRIAERGSERKESLQSAHRVPEGPAWKPASIRTAKAFRAELCGARETAQDLTGLGRHPCRPGRTAGQRLWRVSGPSEPAQESRPGYRRALCPREVGGLLTQKWSKTGVVRVGGPEHQSLKLLITPITRKISTQ